MNIGVLLSSHARPHTLRPQLAAIDAQTLKPSEVVIFHDHADGVQFDVEAARGRKVIATNWTGGVWNRFAFCLWGFSTEFIAVLDDDTIPAPRWLEHLSDCHDKMPALYGVNGVTFPTGSRSPRQYCGWEPSDSSTPCDIVGHGWFFGRELLKRACSLPRCSGIDTAGEDYHLAFTAQNMGLSTVVPPTYDPEALGSVKPDLGTDDKALYRTDGEEGKKARAHVFYHQLGWKPLSCNVNIGGRFYP